MRMGKGAAHSIDYYCSLSFGKDRPVCGKLTCPDKRRLEAVAVPSERLDSPKGGKQLPKNAFGNERASTTEKFMVNRRRKVSRLIYDNGVDASLTGYCRRFHRPELH